uniref:DUF4283 domain-containing protein n=1 Tax=Tanacetum cinerariifolium TaxID=118510 RepID=A0A6L2LWD7_TANCI|nr:hypothetical protein [Tanacetum cinerariifolium]
MRKDVTMNEDTIVVVASTAKEVVTPSVVDMTVENEKRSPLEDTTVLGSFPPLSTPVTTTSGNTPGKSSYAGFMGKPSEKKLNIRTLFTPRGNGIDVVVLVEFIRAISNRFANTAYGFFLGKRVAYPVVANYHLDENLLKEDVSIVSVWVKLHGVPVTAFSDDGLSAIATKLGASEKKTVKKPSQTSQAVLVDNDGEFGTNGGTTNLVNNEATSSGSSFMNIDNDGEC